MGHNGRMTTNIDPVQRQLLDLAARPLPRSVSEHLEDRPAYALLERPRQAQVLSHVRWPFEKAMLPNGGPTPGPNCGIVLVDVIDVAALPRDTHVLLRMLAPLHSEANRIHDGGRQALRGARWDAALGAEPPSQQAWRFLASSAAVMQPVAIAETMDLAAQAAEVEALELRRMAFRRHFVSFMDSLVLDCTRLELYGERAPLFVIALELEPVSPVENPVETEVHRALRMLGHERLVFVTCTR